MEQKGNASNHRDEHGSPHEERERIIKRAGDTIDGYPNSDKDVEKRHGENLLSLSDGYIKKNHASTNTGTVLEWLNLHFGGKKVSEDRSVMVPVESLVKFQSQGGKEGGIYKFSEVCYSN